MNRSEIGMRFLLISDTHGKLDIVDELAARAQADAVIHAGDFGFHDDGSYERLSEREIGLQILHCDLPRDEKARLMALPRRERIAAARSARLLGDFQSYIDGSASFRVPVYAVWGNHEDREVVERVARGDIKVNNLHVLDGTQALEVGPALLYGLGGNLLPGSKMMQSPIAGGGGKVWTTLSQYADLVRAVDSAGDEPGPRIFVSHVSPGKEPFVELLGARTRADFTISGHMGPPTCMVWNPFAVYEIQESLVRLQEGLGSVKSACLGVADQSASRIEDAFSLIGNLPDDTVFMGRRGKVPRWYRAMTHVNLPDAHVGFGVLEITEGRRAIETYAR